MAIVRQARLMSSIPKQFTVKTVKKLKSDIKELKASEEIKQSQTLVPPSAGLAGAQNGNFVLLHAIAEGTGQTQRIGKKIKLIKLRVRGSIANGSVTGPTILRLVFYRDMQVNGVINTNAQLMRDTTAASNYNSDYNLDNRKRFRILYDKSFSMNDCGGATDQVELKTFKFIKKFGRSAFIQYNTAGTTGVIADIISGAIIAVAYTDAAAGQPFAAFTSSLLYRDA